MQAISPETQSDEYFCTFQTLKLCCINPQMAVHPEQGCYSLVARGLVKERGAIEPAINAFLKTIDYARLSRLIGTDIRGPLGEREFLQLASRYIKNIVEENYYNCPIG